ncbi:MAG TPA: peptidylprolyl isomerase, partial [Verrucomicrobiae bacterium]
MNNKMKLIFPAALAALIVGTCSAWAAANPESTNAAPATASSNAATGTSMASLFGDPVIAKGKGVEVKQSALDEVVLGIKSAAAARNQTIPPQQLMGIESQMLNRLIQIQLLLQKSTAADKAAGAAKAEQQLTNLLARAGSQAAFDRQLKSVGMTPEELRTKITQEATATATLTRELGVTVSDADATNFYAAHPTDFEQPETVHVRHVLLLTIDPVTHAPLTADQIAAKRKQIDDILKRAKAGEDFALLATQYSEDPGSKDKGGELPAFGHG